MFQSGINDQLQGASNENEIEAWINNDKSWQIQSEKSHVSVNHIFPSRWLQ